MATSPSYLPDSTSHLTSQTEASRSTEGPSPQQWNALKDEIRVLYEERPLKQVRAILKNRHGFNATERMFKSRLSLWKFSKNSSDKDYQICAVLHKIRRDVGKRNTAFIINGNTRSLRDLRKYIKGRKMTEDEFLTHALHNVQPSQLPEINHVRAVTPEATDGDTMDMAEALDSDDSSENATETAPRSKLTPSTSDASSSPQGRGTEMTLGLGTKRGTAAYDLKPVKSKGSTSTASQYLPPLGQSLASSRRVNPRSSFTKHRPTSSTSSSLASLSNQASTSYPYPIAQNQDAATISLSAFSPDSFSTSPSTLSHPPPRINQTPSPRRSFGMSDVDQAAYSALHSPPIRQFYGFDNFDVWSTMSTDTSSDFEIICDICLKPESEHFQSLCYLDTSDTALYSPTSQPTQTPEGPSPRSIFNPAPELTRNANHFTLPAPTKEHAHSWKWVSRCFAACISYSRSRYTPYSNHNIERPTPFASDDQEGFENARRVLQQADREFKAMLLKDDPMTLIAVTSTLTVLMMHNWQNITSFILESAADVAENLFGPLHPISIITRFTVLTSNLSLMMQQEHITSTKLHEVWQSFVYGWTSPDGRFSIQPEGEGGKRAIPAMYLYCHQLGIEASQEKDHEQKQNILKRCEAMLRDCHQLACQTFDNGHLQATQSLVKLQLCLDRQGRTDDAIYYTRMAIHDGEATLGKWHPRHLETKRILAELYRKVGRDDEAEGIYWHVLEGRIHMLGRKHESTMAMRRNLVNFLNEKGRWSEDREEPCPDRDNLDDIWDWEDVGKKDGGEGVIESY